MTTRKNKQRHDRAIARKRANVRKYYKIWRTGRNRNKIGITRGVARVVAPINFSFNDNPEGVIDFINAIERMFDIRHQVYVVLDQVENIDYGSIVTLLAEMIKFQGCGIKFNGNYPKSTTANATLRTSGFFKYLYSPLGYEDEYKLSNGGKNEIITHAKKTVDPILANKVVESATETIWGEVRRCKGVYSNLIELMHNTHNHAVYGKTGQKHWWLFAKHDESNHKVSFAFIDLGIGIFESLIQKPNDSAWKIVLEQFRGLKYYKNNCDLLKLILSGEFHKAITVTGQEYRGKGLPAIASTEVKNQISSLKVISNDAYAAPGTNDYRLLTKCFNGTYIYWELGGANESIN